MWEENILVKRAIISMFGMLISVDLHPLTDVTGSRRDVRAVEVQIVLRSVSWRNVHGRLTLNWSGRESFIILTKSAGVSRALFEVGPVFAVAVCTGRRFLRLAGSYVVRPKST